MLKKKVILGMSGGMDSSMAAVLLQKQGLEVIGVTLQTHTEANNKHIIEAQELAQSLKIEHHLIDCRSEFRKEVITYFADEYINGRTPNPCVHCNQTIKWKFLLEMAISQNCDFISTGHYVRAKQIDNNYYILKGLDPAKDQSYFLWNLNQEILSKALFPLGELRKAEVRDLARELGYHDMASKKESMGVCFLNGTDYREYLKKFLPPDHEALKQGPVIDQNNTVLGQHDGYPFYTLGQRKGIEGVAKGQCVIDIDYKRRALVAGDRNQLYTNKVLLNEFMITPDQSLWKDQEVFIRIRGLDSVPGYQGYIKETNSKLHVMFEKDVWAITPGQSIVIYQNDVVIGGGIV